MCLVKHTIENLKYQNPKGSRRGTNNKSLKAIINLLDDYYITIIAWAIAFKPPKYENPNKNKVSYEHNKAIKGYKKPIGWKLALDDDLTNDQGAR